MKFQPSNLKLIQDSLRIFHNVVGSNLVLPHSLRPNLDYEERMKRRAAVLVPLVNVDGVASVLFTVRALNLNTHAAQVSFPGGHVDENETLEQAAVRELKEETNLHAEPLGMWKAARAYTGTMVTPILGILPPMTAEEVRRCGVFRPSEVSAAFHLPVEHLVDPANRYSEQLSSFRSARFSGGPEPIWGLTAFFLEGVLRDVLAPSFGLHFVPTQEKIVDPSVESAS
jgi:nudix motif 8